MSGVRMHYYALIVLLCVGGFTGCGLRGDLYLPESATEQSQ